MTPIVPLALIERLAGEYGWTNGSNITNLMTTVMCFKQEKGAKDLPYLHRGLNTILSPYGLEIGRAETAKDRAGPGLDEEIHRILRALERFPKAHRRGDLADE